MAKKRSRPSGWNSVADWYHGWVGKDGSQHHRKLAIPAALDLLQLQANEQVLDLGCGQGVLAPHIARIDAAYTGIDISPKLIRYARRNHSNHGRFLIADVRDLHRSSQMDKGAWDACVFLLSIQDMNPLDRVLRSAAWALKPGGRLAIIMTHPCFRIPRQSGWGYDEKRKLQYRRLDSYLSALSVPMKQHKQGATISFHRPLNSYINAMAQNNLLIDRLCELPANLSGGDKAQRRANQEFPLFLALRARKVEV